VTPLPGLPLTVEETFHSARDAAAKRLASATREEVLAAYDATQARLDQLPITNPTSLERGAALGERVAIKAALARHHIGDVDAYRRLWADIERTARDRA